jgi:hypothetical protein
MFKGNVLISHSDLSEEKWRTQIHKEAGERNLKPQNTTHSLERVSLLAEDAACMLIEQI